MFPFKKKTKIPEGFEFVTKEDIVKQGYLGTFYLPMLISRWVLIKTLSFKERLKVLWHGKIFVSETYSDDKPEEKTYTLHV